MADNPGESAERSPPPPGSWLRRNDGLEFDRVIFFTDAVFAIALTLLVVQIAVPVLTVAPDKPSTMLNALSDTMPEFIGFFIAFILIARYWMAHHLFFAQLRAVDRGLIGINLIYLAFVAFLPFPSALVGHYEQNPVSVLLFAACLCIISGLEVVEFRHAQRNYLFRKPMPDDVYRYGVISSLSPVVLFIVTAPLAFINPTICLLSWLLSIPIGIFLGKRAPAGLEDVMIGYESPKKRPPPT
jgi:uncharacterized membrane protein